MNKNLSVSIVIPAYNCEKTIFKTLQGALNQSYGDVEVIVVDDGSRDATPEIISGFKKARYFCQKNSGPASARNLGAKNAQGDIVFFTDSDCIPHQNWIEKAVVYFTDQEVGVVAGSYGIANKEYILARCIYSEILYRHSRLMPKYPKSFGSYNFGVRKKVFDAVGGFNIGYKSASGEDNDLSYKILNAGYKIIFEKEALVDHYHPIKIWKYLSEQFRHGFWRVKMYIDHPKMIKGDDYTFWKDVVEIPIAFLTMISLACFFCLPKIFMPMGTFFFVSLLILEIVYGLIIVRSIFGAIFMSLVMFCRSFARMFGFSSGIFNFLLQIISTKEVKKVK